MKRIVIEIIDDNVTLNAEGVTYLEIVGALHHFRDSVIVDHLQKRVGKQEKS